MYLAGWLFLRVYFCHFLTPGFSQSNSNCVLSNRDVTYIAENNLYPFNSSGLADRAAKAPEMIFVSPCAFAPQVPGSRRAIADPGAEQEGCGQPLPAGTRRPAWQNPPGGGAQVREKRWERGSLLILQSCLTRRVGIIFQW